MDIASLGLAIDPSQAEKGTLALDKIAVAARKFEDNVVRMGGAFTKAGRDAVASAGALGDAMRQLHARAWRPISASRNRPSPPCSAMPAAA